MPLSRIAKKIKKYTPIYNLYRDATEDNKNKDKNLPALYEYLKDNENNKKEGWKNDWTNFSRR